MARRPDRSPLRLQPRGLAASAWGGCAVAGLLVAATVLAPLLAYARAHMPVVLEDDGFYYAQVARQLARTGRSTFDGLTPTNGYHPLWLLLLALKTRLFGDATWSVVSIEALCLGAASAVLVRASRSRTWGAPLLFTALFAHYVGAMAGLGMEVSLFALCAAVFVTVLASVEARPAGRDGLVLGAAAAACIGARIDSAVFVGPMVLICGRSRESRGVALAVLALVGLAYGAVNLALFGAALPISSAVKSLGGLQVNHRFVTQMGVELHAFGRGGGGRMLLTLAGCAVAPLLALSAPRGSPARTVGFGAGLGGLLFVAKLLFGSSWQIWPWYSFPLVFVLATALLALAPRIDSGPRLPALGIAALGVAAVLLVGARAVRQGLGAPPSEGFYAVNRAGAAQAAQVTRGAPIAMGDRAGSFAWFYPGPVVQLEGLVNDRRWLQLLRRREPPAPELCRRGVRYVAAYTPEMGRYGAWRVPLIRPSLSQYAAPAIAVASADEVMAVQNRSAFDATALVTDGDPVLRLWRLSCGAPARVAAPPPS